jgi:aspartyl-tRNA(Asn)/glutamyl-tRNA(Gln) amidotransferase subunit A
MILDLTLSQIDARLEKRELSSTELTRACLDRIEATRDLNAFVHVDEKGALAAARAADDRKARLSPLDGVPIALKDLFLTEGVPTTAGSKILAGFVPPYDGAMPERLKRAGAVLIGKTNLDEFAMGSSTEHSAFGAAKNPWDPTKVPGGSSGGSAIAVAAGLCFGALGTDTGGSIRQPASMCGVYGLKPTYGRVSRFGTIAFASSLDQVGPFGRSVLDLAHQLQTISGFDERDSTSANEPVPEYTRDLELGVRGSKIGIPAEYFIEGIDPEVEAAIKRGLEVLKDAGAELVPIELPHTRYAVSTYYVIATAEASSNLARYDGVRYGPRADERELLRMYSATRHQGFGQEVKRRIVLGTYVLSAGYYEAYYGKAQRVRTLIRRDFEDAFKSVDLIVTPVSPFAAFGLGERMTDPLSMYLADVFTLSVSLAGLPGISVPAGHTNTGLPIGMQMIAPWFCEPHLLRAAHSFERATDHSKRRPAARDR